MSILYFLLLHFLGLFLFCDHKRGCLIGEIRQLIYFSNCLIWVQYILCEFDKTIVTVSIILKQPNPRSHTSIQNMNTVLFSSARLTGPLFQLQHKLGFCHRYSKPVTFNVCLMFVYCLFPVPPLALRCWTCCWPRCSSPY